MGKNIKKETKVLKEAKAKRYTSVLRIVRVTEALAAMGKRVCSAVVFRRRKCVLNAESLNFGINKLRACACCRNAFWRSGVGKAQKGMAVVCIYGGRL